MNEYIRTKSDEEAVRQGCVFNSSEPERIITWIEKHCTLSQQPFTGQPMRLMDWQKDLIHQLYGWRKADGSRRFARASLWIPKKNGKSGLLSALCAYELQAKAGQGIYIIGPTKDQANIVFNDCGWFMQSLRDTGNTVDEFMTSKWNVRHHLRTIDNRARASQLKVVSCSRHSASGFSASYVVCDEIADWPSWGREVYEQLKYAGAARPDSLLFTLSTAQYDRQTIGYELYQLCQDILTGEKVVIDFLPIVYAADEGRWKEETEWQRANPSWGVTIRPEEFRAAYEEAVQVPTSEPAFKCLRLNIWSTPTRGWIPGALWDLCKEDFDETDLHGCVADIGLDMARSADLASYVLWIKKDDCYYMIPRCFSPADTARLKEKSDGVPYQHWASRGFITLTPGNQIDPRVIRASIARDAEVYKIREIRYDANLALETIQILQDEGYD